MRTIEITTTQKVTIQYEVATLRDRIFAFIIDSLILYGSIILIAFILFSQINMGSSDDAQLIFYLIILPIFLFYTLVSEIIGNGQTLGKRAVGIKVVKLNGRAATVSDYVIRWTFRCIDIYLALGSVASVMVASSDKGQRIGGVMSGTIVIRMRPALAYNLGQILNMYKTEKTPSYTGLRQFNDEDMLLVRKVITRANRYPNPGHRRVVDQLVDSLCTKLQIERPAMDGVAFLQDILREYVVATR